MTAPPELTVIAPSFGDADKLPALLDSLRAQTLPADRFEVLVVDDGNEPALDLGAAGAGTKLIRQRHAGPAAARNMALRHARGRVLVLVNADGVLAPDALARHLAHHPPEAPARAVLGRFDWLPERLNPLVIIGERAGVMFPYSRLEPHAANPFWAFWTGNLSVPAQAVRSVGGFDESFERAMWEDVELGYRLERAGVPLHYDPDIGCDHDHEITVASWARHAQWYGHEWVRFARKHGGATLPIMGGADEPTEQFAQQCLAGLLHQHDAHQGRLIELQRALDALGASLDAAPERRAEILETESATAHELFVAVNTVARMAGIAGAIWGYDPDALTTRAQALARPTVVHTVAGEWDLDTVPRLLDVVGDHADLLIASYIYLAPGQLPDDPRLQVIRIPRTLPTHQTWVPVLQATDAEAFIFIEGPPLPTAASVRALGRFLGVSPWVGAIGLALPQGLPHASAKLVAEVPRHVVATSRRILQLDPGGPGSFLDRLQERALFQVALTLAGG